MFPDENKAAIESLLFVSKEPVSIKVLSQILEISQDDVSQLMNQLIEEYSEPDRGIQITEVAHGFQMCTKTQFAGYVERLYKPQNTHTLSKAALETLAIIAYKQPITRAEVEVIRGVKIDSSLGTLIDKNLVCEVGRKEGPGRPILFGTTPSFLKYFGLKDIKGLPDPEEFLTQNTPDDDEIDTDQMEMTSDSK